MGQLSYAIEQGEQFPKLVEMESKTSSNPHNADNSFKTVSVNNEGERQETIW